MKILLVSYSHGRALRLQKVMESQGYAVLASGSSGDKIFSEMWTLAPELKEWIEVYLRINTVGAIRELPLFYLS